MSFRSLQNAVKSLIQWILNNFEKIRERIGTSSLFPENIPSDRELELIDKVAKLIIDRQLQIPAISFLETFKPLGFIGSQFGMFYTSPILGFLGDVGITASELMILFEKIDNVERLIRKLEESLKK